MKTSIFKKMIAAVMLCIMCISSTMISYASLTYGYGHASTPVTIYASSTLSQSDIACLQQAINLWNGTRVGTVLKYGGVKGTLPSAYLTDGVNGVTKENLASNVTGRTYNSTNGSKIVESNIAINKNINYANGSTSSGQYDLVSVFVHELGHALGLADNMSYGSVMNGSYSGNRTPSSSDINELDSLY